MSAIQDALDAAIAETEAARKRVSKIKTNQIRGIDSVASLKATALTWFNTHRRSIVETTAGRALDLSHADEHFTIIINATARNSAKSTYSNALRGAKDALVKIQAAALAIHSAQHVISDDDLAPDFSPLAGNQQMRDILARRWNECSKCVSAEAHLAAIVMMGGLLEALFVARANKMTDKSTLVAASNAPKDKATGKTINYNDWMLDSYIKVAFELKWITESAKDLADNLKEYRNFVHPAKELRYGVTLDLNDSSIFWQVTKALARQLLLSTHD